MTDTIAAIATGAGRSAIGIVRLSGPESLSAVERLFTPRSGRPLRDYPAGMLVYGSLRDEMGRLIDECLVTRSAAPASYTGEDTAELQCHGSPAVLNAALEALFHLGVRQARAGEFTQRAFLNGRMDLTQAEAVINLIDAETAAAARCAASQLGGALRGRLEEIYDELVDLIAHFDVVLDYSDEALEPFDEAEAAQAVGRASEGLARLAATARRGRRLYDGVPCAIVGRPNSGKSSLLNALLGYDRAIVSDIPGTTRDTVEERATVGGVLLRLIDTAGLRETEDAVEQVGVARALEAAERAGLVLVLVDGAAPLTQGDRDLLARSWPGAQTIYIATKADRPEFSMPPLPEGALAVSSVTGAGLDALEARMATLFGAGALEESGELLTSARQAEAIARAADYLAGVQRAMESGMTPDAVLSDVELALEAIGEVTGRTVKEDVTERIFSRFCVGK